MFLYFHQYATKSYSLFFLLHLRDIVIGVTKMCYCTIQNVIDKFQNLHFD